MQQVAQLKPNPEPARANAVEVIGVSHVYHGREGAVPALTDIDMTVPAGSPSSSGRPAAARLRC